MLTMAFRSSTSAASHMSFSSSSSAVSAQTLSTRKSVNRVAMSLISSSDRPMPFPTVMASLSVAFQVSQFWV